MSRYRTAGLFFILSVAWGAAFPAIKAGLTYFPPVLFAAIRYDLASILMVGYVVFATNVSVPRTRREWRVVCIAGVCMIAGYQALLFIGEQYTTSAIAAVVVGLNPILTTGFARGLLPGERLGPLGIIGLCLGLGGVTVLANPDPSNLSASRGPLLVFGATASFALGSVLTRRAETGLPFETLEAWAMVVGAVTLHGISLGTGEPQFGIVFTVEALAALGYLVVVASAGGFLIYFDLLERVGPVELNLVSYVVPPVAAVVGIVVLGEVITVRTLIGFLTIVAGFVVLKRRALVAELSAVTGDAVPWP